MKGNIVETSTGVVWVKHDWLCQKYSGNLPEDLFFAVPNAEGYICITKSRLNEIENKSRSYENRMLMLNKTAELNNKGIAY